MFSKHKDSLLKCLDLFGRMAAIVIFLAVWPNMPILAGVEKTAISGSKIDMYKIEQIESGGNPLAFNKRTGARGLFQITNVCLADWNASHPKEMHKESDLFRPDINRKIADWYLTKRIPKMLRYYGKEVTIERILISYNAGIYYAVHDKRPPRETRNYLRKYFEK